MRDIHVRSCTLVPYTWSQKAEVRMATQSRPKESGGAYVHLISGSHSVTVNNGSGLALDGSSVLPTSAVIVTPLTSTPNPTPVNTPSCTQLISKVLIKAFTKGSKKDPRIFTLRNINPDEVSTLDKLERVIRDQLSMRYLGVGLILATYKVVI